MKEVGRSVAFLSHPGKGVLVVSTYVRLARSITRQSSSAHNNIRPKASIRSGFFRNRLSQPRTDDALHPPGGAAYAGGGRKDGGAIPRRPDARHPQPGGELTYGEVR